MTPIYNFLCILYFQIRVNSVNPTIVKTDLVDRCWTKDELTNMINKTPLGQLPGNIHTELRYK